MSKRFTKHSTFTIERSFAVPPARVFAAFADAKAKARWFVGPDEWEKSNLKLDFKVGGRESVSGGPPGGPIHSYNAVYQTAMHESAGNPSAVNGWDSNAAAGTPSIGLMQTIKPTFNAYALAGHYNIYNPVDNIIAAARYAQAVYGGLDNVVAARGGGSNWFGY